MLVTIIGDERVKANVVYSPLRLQKLKILK